ncbi:Secreted protein containing C-terminal beta-propeller domain [Alteromonadaceae bacterium Bs31]|nr:Secreted protein containing C-terminal beta-propeller domain [Alteromonadaceae bacterium Bs31]
MTRILLSLSVVFILSACGGSGETSDTGGPVNPSISYDKLKAPAPSASVLRLATEEELLLLLKNGVRRDVHYAVGRPIATQQEIENTPVASPTDPQSGTFFNRPGDQFSGTNVQVGGVDEADHVKYDGQHLYIHAWPRWRTGEDLMYWSGESFTPDRIRILRTDPASATATPVSEIVMAQSYSDTLEMYLLEGANESLGAEAIVTLQAPDIFDWCGLGAPEWGWYGGDNSIKLSLYSMAKPENPELSWQLELDGMLHDSRRIGDMLYVVSSYIPPFALFEGTPDERSPAAFGGDLDTATSLAESAIADLSLEDLLPSYLINGGERQLLHGGEQCLVNADLGPYDGYRSLHYITAIDLRKQQVTDTLCTTAPTQAMYSSTDAIYLVANEAANNWDDSYSVLHKIGLSGEQVNYLASGAVPGNLGWSTPSFRMDEHDGYMRVITSAFDSSANPDHRLWVLEENSISKTLDVVGMLPEEGSSESIGKPGEDIYGVRFWGDKAYVVTYKSIDPLYLLDLADPSAPSIAGELELPGFSTYLHPLDEGYVFGFGADPESDEGGLKASLFDVRNPSLPLVVGEIKMTGWPYSDALQDHKSFSFVPTSEDQLRITVPVNMGEGSELIDNGSSELTLPLGRHAHLLLMLEINGLAGENASLSLQGALNPDSLGSADWFNHYALTRGVMHGDAVYYVDEPSVWSALWLEPGKVFGPF